MDGPSFLLDLLCGGYLKDFLVQVRLFKPSILKKMKKTFFMPIRLLAGAWCMLLLTTVALQAQEKMPVTTPSIGAEEQFHQGVEQFTRLHFNQAKKHFDEALRMDPDFAMAHFYLAATLMQGSGFEAEHLNKAIELSDEISSGEKHLIRFGQAMSQKDTQAMDKHSEILIDLWPEDESLRMWVGLAHYSAGDYDLAIRHLTRAIEINPDYHPAHNMLGYSHMMLGDMDSAEESFIKYLEVLPGEANPHDSYGEFLLRNGRFNEAIAHYRKALKISPDFTSSLKGLADSYLFQGDMMMARKSYQDYSRNNDNYNIKLNGMLYEASVDLHENNPEAALRNIDRYIRMAEQKGLPYYQIRGMAYKGYILTETGQPEEGIKYYRKAKEMIATADLPASMKKDLNTQAHIWEFYALSSDNDMEAAEQARVKCRKVLLDHGSADHWKTYYQSEGIMQLKQGRYDQAREQLAKAWDTPETWYYTGLTWQRQGNPIKARQWYQKVTRHYQNSLELGGVRNKALAGLQEK